MLTHLEAAEVLQAPQLGGAVCRGGSQDLVHGRETHTPNAPPVAPKHTQESQVSVPRQGPEFGCAVLRAGGQQFVVGRH